VADAFYLPTADPDRFAATSRTVGPWDPGSQHAGPPSALLTRQIERLPSSIPGRRRSPGSPWRSWVRCRWARSRCAPPSPVPAGRSSWSRPSCPAAAGWRYGPGRGASAPPTYRSRRRRWPGCRRAGHPGDGDADGTLFRLSVLGGLPLRQRALRRARAGLGLDPAAGAAGRRRGDLVPSAADGGRRLRQRDQRAAAVRVVVVHQHRLERPPAPDPGRRVDLHGLALHIGHGRRRAGRDRAVRREGPGRPRARRR
jgi:hypothetical protein